MQESPFKPKALTLELYACPAWAILAASSTGKEDVHRMIAQLFRNSILNEDDCQNYFWKCDEADEENLSEDLEDAQISSASILKQLIAKLPV